MERSPTNKIVARWSKSKAWRSGYRIPKYDNCKNPMVVKMDSGNDDYEFVDKLMSSKRACGTMEANRKILNRFFKGEQCEQYNIQVYKEVASNKASRIKNGMVTYDTQYEIYKRKRRESEEQPGGMATNIINGDVQVIQEVHHERERRRVDGQQSDNQRDTHERVDDDSNDDAQPSISGVGRYSRNKKPRIQPSSTAKKQ